MDNIVLLPTYYPQINCKTLIFQNLSKINGAGGEESAYIEISTTGDNLTQHHQAQPTAPS